MAEGLGRREVVPRPEPGSRRAGRRRAPQVVRGRDAAVSLRRPPHGAHAELHDRRRDHAHAPPPGACRCCGRWGTTRSACRRRTPRSRKAAIPAPSPSATSSRSASRCTAWAGRSTGAARSRPPTRPTTAGRSGSSCASTRRASPTARRRPSSGARTTRPCSPTSRSIDGRCERCGAEVEAKILTQWYFRITDYADALLDEMADLEDWPDRVLTMQRNWIGRSHGARVVFSVDGSGEELPVFTTRPDTLFGATFFALAPENPMVAQLVAGSEHEAEVLDYVRHTAARSEVERETKEKDGVFTGRYAINPVNGERIPIWVADYVLMGYGTGAIMAVPAHDERDFAFAERYGIEIRPVVTPEGGELPEEGAYSAHSDERGARQLRPVHRAAEPRGEGEDRRLAGRAGSRRGDDRLPPARLAVLAPALLGLPDPDHPLPGVRRGRRCPDDQLPVVLPDITEVAPRGRSPLAAAEDWVNVTCPTCGGAGAPRDRHDGHVRRLVVVLHPLHRSRQHGGCRSTARSPTTGCRSTSTSAASSTPCCTCSTRASSRR